MAPQADYLVDVVFTLPGQAQIIRIAGKERTPLSSGPLAVSRFSSVVGGACLYCAEVGKTRVYFSPTPGFCVQTSPQHYAFAEGGSWLGLTLPPETEVKEIQRLEQLLAEHAGLEKSEQGGNRTAETGGGELVEINSDGQLRFDRISVGASPYVKEIQKQALVLATVAAPHVERAAPHVASGIERGADVLAQAIVYSAEQCSLGLAAGGQFVSQRVTPAEQPSAVTPEEKLRAQRIRLVTEVAAQATQSVADGVVAFASSVAGAVSDAVSSTNAGKRVKESQTGLKDVASASIGAVGKVFVALEEGTKQVFKEAGSVTTEFVRHKHGHEAGALAAEYVEVAGNVVASGVALNQVGVRTVVETTAHVTVSDLTRRKRDGIVEIAAPARITNGPAKESTL